MSESMSFVEFLGPLLVGVIVNSIVFGVCLMQLLTYLSSKYEDSWKLRFLIAWVYFIDLFQVWQSTWTLWHYTVANYNNPSSLSFGPWQYASLPIVGSFAIVPIQLFMGVRIMKFANSKPLFYMIAFGSITQAALACSAATLGMVNPAVSNHVNIMPLADAWLGFAVLCDSTITGLLLYYLWRSRTGIRKTDSIVRRLCTTTIEAAVPVVLLSLGDLIGLTVSPTTNFHYMFALPVGRLYTNTLMVTLNDRKRLRTQMEQWTVNSIHLSKIPTKHYPTNPRQPLPVHLNVQTMDLLKSGSDTMTSPLSALSETSTQFSPTASYAVPNVEKISFGCVDPGSEKSSLRREGGDEKGFETRSWNEDIEKGVHVVEMHEGRDDERDVKRHALDVRK